MNKVLYEAFNMYVLGASMQRLFVCQHAYAVHLLHLYMLYMHAVHLFHLYMPACMPADQVNERTSARRSPQP